MHIPKFYEVKNKVQSGWQAAQHRWRNNIIQGFEKGIHFANTNQKTPPLTSVLRHAAEFSGYSLEASKDASKKISQRVLGNNKLLLKAKNFVFSKMQSLTQGIKRAIPESTQGVLQNAKERTQTTLSNLQQKVPPSLTEAVKERTSLLKLGLESGKERFQNKGSQSAPLSEWLSVGTEFVGYITGGTKNTFQKAFNFVKSRFNRSPQPGKSGFAKTTINWFKEKLNSLKREHPEFED